MKLKRTKRFEAEARNAAWAALPISQQISSLIDRGFAHTKQYARLCRVAKRTLRTGRPE